ncbi:MAG: transcription termination factor Rho [Gemmatimonadota bacterium]|nr:transcription termination factor Rho [Gemmatimonadota bacterium]
MDSTTPPPDAGQLPDARDEASSPAVPPPSPAPASPPMSSNSSDGGGDSQSYQQNDTGSQNSNSQYGGGPAAPMHDRQQYSDQSNDRGNYNRNQQGGRGQGGQGGNRNDRNNGRRGRHNQRGRGRPNQNQNQNQNQGGGENRQREQQSRQPIAPIVPDGESIGWYDPQRDGGFIRRAANSYLAEPGDAYVPLNVARQYNLRRGDNVRASTGHDHRGRVVVAEVQEINNQAPDLALRRPDFGSLIASYPERKLKLETGRPAKGGPELTRRAIDLIAPIGYGQRALIVAPARAGKTMLLQAIVEGVAINHPQAVLLVLLVDERPEEVSEMITWGYGEVVASSFDMPAARHTDVTEMVLERARRLVEMGKDVVIVLDSITRMGRAFNTVERGTGRTLSGGLDATAMAKPKAFFGSARSVAPEHGGGSLTIIATALVETGSRMDDVIFEEFKGTGNCEIKLDRSLAEKRIFPAIDVATSGTRREEKLFRPDQLEHVYTLRRGLQQMPSSSAMEWLIKRIAGTPGNDALLEGL